MVPILVILGLGPQMWVETVVVAALVGLIALGAVGAHLGGAPKGRAALRVVLGGAAAMAVTGLVGQLFDVSVS